MMKRLLLVFVLLVIPLQTSWAAVAAYCKHEKGIAAKHFGHHVHVHKAVDGKKEVASKLTVDDDCRYCHAEHDDHTAGCERRHPNDASSAAAISATMRR